MGTLSLLLAVANGLIAAILTWKAIDKFRQRSFDVAWLFVMNAVMAVAVAIIWAQRS